jgi:hypothetical protein
VQEYEHSEEEKPVENRPWTPTYRLQRHFIGFVNALFNYVLELIDKNNERKRREDGVKYD